MFHNVRIPDPMKGYLGRAYVDLCTSIAKGILIDPRTGDGWQVDAACTRPVGHGKRHAASTGTEIIAVWTDEEADLAPYGVVG